MADYNTIIQIVADAILVFIGLGAGYFLSIVSEKRKDREALKKIKFLINSDFSLINNNLQDQIKRYGEIAENFIVKDTGLMCVLSVASTQNALAYMGFKIGPFVYWETIVTTGSLMKLTPSELRTIYMIHNVITTMIEVEQKAFEKFFYEILELVSKEPLKKVAAETFQKKLKEHLTYSLLTCNRIEERLKLLSSNISWIDLQIDSSVLTPRELQDNVENESYLRDDDITVYSDGTEVDHKGTILKFGSKYKI